MKDFLINLLGGLTEKEHKTRLDEEIENIRDKLYEPYEEEFAIGDIIWFYYVSRIDYQVSCYYQAKIRSITTNQTEDGSSNRYTLDTSKLRRRFQYDFSIDEEHISKSRTNLRNKIVNSDCWTFLTFMSYDNIELRDNR